MDNANPGPGVQRIIDLVHRRDVLMSERMKLIGNLDAEIAKIDFELAAAGGIIAPKSATPEAARQRSLKLGVRSGSFAEKVLLALAENPRATLGQLAESAYGADNVSNRHKVRAVQFHLRKTGRLSKADGAS